MQLKKKKLKADRKIMLVDTSQSHCQLTVTPASFCPASMILAQLWREEGREEGYLVVAKDHFFCQEGWPGGVE